MSQPQRFEMSSEDNPAPRRGNPGRNHAQRLLARMEYDFVKFRRRHWSDAKLDREYALSDLEKDKRSTADRSYVFAHAKSPKRGRPLPEYVLRRLEIEPDMQGLREIAGSTFWKLAENPPSTRRTAQKLVDECLKTLRLVRLPVGLEEAWLSRKWRAAKQLDANVQWREGDEIVRDRIEQLSMQFPNNLNLIALLGALYREACLSFEPEAASYLGIRFWMLLEDFLAQPEFASIDSELLDFAVNRIVFDRDEAGAKHGFHLLDRERLPGSAIGLLLSEDDSDVEELQPPDA